MLIHNLQTEFRLLAAIVHKRDLKNIPICAQMPRLHRNIFIRISDPCVRIRTFSAISVHPIRISMQKICDKEMV